MKLQFKKTLSLLLVLALCTALLPAFAVPARAEESVAESTALPTLDAAYDADAGAVTVSNLPETAARLVLAGYEAEKLVFARLEDQLSNPTTLPVPGDQTFDSLKIFCLDGDGVPAAEASIAFFSDINTKRNEELREIAAINNGTLPEIHLETEDQIPQFIMGKYSDETVTGYDTAIDSLNDIDHLMLITDPAESFEGQSISTRNGQTFYKLQQMYKGLRVYGKQIIVATDEGGEITALSADYNPLTDIDITPTISAEAARAVASEVCGYDNTAEAELIVVSTDRNIALAWLFSDDLYDISIDATTGFLYFCYDNLYTQASTGRINTGTKQISFPITEQDDVYYLYDPARNIYVFDSSKNKKPEANIVNTITYQNGELNADNPIAAASAYFHLTQTFDFFKDVLGILSHDGLGTLMALRVNYSGSNSGGAEAQYGLINVSKDAENSIVSLDTIAHEFTHAVEDSVSNMLYEGESGVIMEALSDFMGSLVEETYQDGNSDWIQGGKYRDLANPTQRIDKQAWFLCYPKEYLGDGWYSGADSSTFVHHNSTILSHALYRLYTQSSTSNAQMANLLYLTLHYLPRDCDFTTFYSSLCKAAEDLHFEESFIRKIHSVFSDAGIVYMPIIKEIDYFEEGINLAGGYVKDALTKKPITGYTMKVRAGTDTVSGSTINIGTYSDIEGQYELQELTPGRYTIEVSHYQYITQYKNIITGTAYTAKQLNQLLSQHVYLEPKEQFTITVTASDGSNLLAGVAICAYDSDGNTLQHMIATDSTGIYKLNSMPNGTYTIVGKKAGYTDGSVSVTVNNGNVTAPVMTMEKLPGNFAVTFTMPNGQVMDLLAAADRLNAAGGLQLPNQTCTLKATVTGDPGWKLVTDSDTPWFTTSQQTNTDGSTEVSFQIVSSTLGIDRGVLTLTEANGTIHTLNIFRQAHRITGIVKLPDGTPAGVSTSVRIWNDTGFSQNVTLNGTGAFSLAVPDGSYSITVTHPDYEEKTLALPAVNMCDADAGVITLSKSSNVTGTIVDANGQPLAGVSVWWSKYTFQSKTVVATTDANGRFGLYVDGSIYHGETKSILKFTLDGRIPYSTMFTPPKDGTVDIGTIRMSADDPDSGTAIYAQGQCGDKLQWSIAKTSNTDSTCTLRITGTGNMWNSCSDMWTDFRNTIYYLSLPEGLTSLGGGTFSELSTVYTVELPASLTEIPSEAFHNNSLQSITVASGSEAFTAVDGVLYSKDMTKLVCCPSSYETGISRFWEFKGSAIRIYSDFQLDFTVPETVTEIGDYAFQRVRFGQIHLPDQLKIIGVGAFSQSSIAAIDLPDTVTSIGRDAFRWCDNLRQIRLPVSCTSTFTSISDCTNLETVVIPENYRNWGNVLNNCPNLKAVYCLGPMRSYIPSIVELGTTYPDFKIYYKAGQAGWSSPTMEDWDGNPVPTAPFDPADLDAVPISSGSCGESITWVLEKDGTLTLTGSGPMSDYYSFNYGSDYQAPWSGSAPLITRIIVGEGITTIGNYAFSSCGKITTVTLPKSLTSIGNFAFDDCLSLTAIDIPDAVTTIGQAAFRDCWALETAELPDSLTDLKAEAFARCDRLSSITWPAGLISIGKQAFYCCTALQTLDLPDEITVIGDSAFRYCTGLTSVTLPAKLETINTYTFSDCYQLQTVVFPDCLTTVGASAFSRCETLAELILPDSLTTIYGGAFYQCKSLTDVFIPNTVTTISSGAFQNCTGLLDIFLPAGLTEISAQCFDGCTSLIGIIIPEAVTTIRRNAFRGCTNLLSYVFMGDAPTHIETGAFPAQYSVSYTFYYQEGAVGWTTPTWYGPNGVSYTTEII